MAEELNIPMPSMAPSYRMPRRPGMDPHTKRLALIAGGIGATLLAIVGAWSFTGHHAAGVPVIEADSRPLRVKPDHPGGMDVAGQDDAILSGAGEGQEALAPPPEVPAPQVLKEQAAKEQAARDQAAKDQAAKLAAPVDPAPKPVARADPPPPVAAAPQAAAKPVAKAPAPVKGGPQVQLAAMPSEEGANAEWQRLAHKAPDLFAGRKPAVARTEHDGKVFWRLRTSGFTDIAQATGFCEKIRAKGGNCSLATF